MNSLDCGTTRDLLPLHVRQQLLPHEGESIERHLGACGECRQELALVAVLADSAPAASAQLQQRVLDAVLRRAAIRRTVARRVAMAAAVAALALGGSLLFQVLLPPTGGVQESVATLGFDESAGALSWAVSLDPLLYGGPAFEHLTVEELEVVLAELER
jgi:predicted anti-sigma-YlaC factor YlaD